MLASLRIHFSAFPPPHRVVAALVGKPPVWVGGEGVVPTLRRLSLREDKKEVFSVCRWEFSARFKKLNPLSFDEQARRLGERGGVGVNHNVLFETHIKLSTHMDEMDGKRKLD